MEYLVKRVTDKNNKWKDAEIAEINHYKWLDNGYEPKAQAQLSYDNEYLYVKLLAYETNIRAVNKNLNEPVYEDSCLEFFFKPKKFDEYINIEMNSLGAMLIGMGTTRHNRKALTPDLKYFDIKPSVDSEKWSLEYQIPFSYLKELYGEFDLKDGFMGNFFKCGDLADIPHYGVWSDITGDEENFHLSAFFSAINFQ